MACAALRSWVFRGVQSRGKIKRVLKPLEKFKKVFAAPFCILFTASSVLAQEVIQIPFDYGSVTGSHSVYRKTVPGSTPLIVHIQDAHELVGIQRNIASIIQILVRDYGFRLIFEEGNSGEIKTHRVFWLGDKKFRSRLAGGLLEEGKLSGPEYAHILGGRTFRLFGAEDSYLYEENVRVRDGLSFYATQIQNEIDRIDLRLEKEIPSALPRELARYCRRSETFWRGRGEPPFQVEKNGGRAELSWWEALRRLDRAAREALITDPAQKTFLEKMDAVALLRRMSRLRLTRPDLDEFLAKRDVIRTLIEDSLILSEFFAKVSQFYSLAERRDKALVMNTLEGMKRLGQNRAILVAGGFHTRGIANSLEGQGVAYHIVSPVSLFFGAETLRQPNLFNLPEKQARLFVDLRAMKLARAARRGFYYEALRRDAMDLQRHKARQEGQAGMEWPGEIRGSTALLLSLKRGPFGEENDTLTQWLEGLLRSAASLEIVVAMRHRDEVIQFRSLLAKRVSETSLLRRLKVVRLLTRQDVGVVRRMLYGKKILFAGSEENKKWFEKSGFVFSHFMTLPSTGQSLAREALLRELEVLQTHYRIVVASA